MLAGAAMAFRQWSSSVTTCASSRRNHLLRDRLVRYGERIMVLPLPLRTSTTVEAQMLAESDLEGAPSGALPSAAPAAPYAGVEIAPVKLGSRVAVHRTERGPGQRAEGTTA